MFVLLNIYLIYASAPRLQSARLFAEEERTKRKEQSLKENGNSNANFILISLTDKSLLIMFFKKLALIFAAFVVPGTTL